MTDQSSAYVTPEPGRSPSPFEVSALGEQVCVTCLACGQDALPDEALGYYWPSLALVNDAAERHRCTLTAPARTPTAPSAGSGASS